MAEDKYLVDPETGDRFRLGGCLISDKPSNLPRFGGARCLSNLELPSSVDLRQFMSPVEHQDNLNSCNAIDMQQNVLFHPTTAFDSYIFI
ncbi:unnamed protein product [Rotaria sordida]|uniref:Uncharacterized protein n=1 Tax=Rotaria sordida TaxID=392033 RepID=A0A819EHH7_9BILA|nr:unnamed protein product [Rotaria sordida]CAF3850449.1 unnamed protein product [Rotaria sordida]CAF3940426.1 unnamed protein product [Rotaria sordida]